MLKIILKPYGCRSFSNSRVWKKAETQNKVTKPPQPLENDRIEDLITHIRPTNYEKWILVLSGKFKSRSEIPHKISFHTMENAKSRFRIRGSNVLMVGTLILCAYHVWLGKKNAREGYTIEKQLRDRDKHIIEKIRREN